MEFQNKNLMMSIFVSVLGLTLLTGCAWWPFGGSSTKNESYKSVGQGDVLLSIDGVPVLTVQDYEEQLDMARQANQQVDMLIQMMPNAEKDYVFRGMQTAKLMKAWVHKQGIDETPEFKKQLKQVQEAMDLQLCMKYFDDAHPIHVSDSDVAKYYEEKKDSIPALVLSPGGVNVAYVRFDTKAKAEQFFDKVKEVKKTEAFKAAAEANKLKMGDAIINEQSSFGDHIKSAVLNVKKFPHVQVVKAGDDAYWVLLASGKSDTKYRDLKSPEVQHGLKKMLTDERKAAQMEQVIDKLKKDFNVVENNKYFDDKENKRRAALAEMNKEVADAQGQDEAADMPVKV